MSRPESHEERLERLAAEFASQAPELTDEQQQRLRHLLSLPAWQVAA